MQKLLTAFGDATQASDYAKMSIATCIKAGVINSNEGNMDRVKEYITRAAFFKLAIKPIYFK